MNKCIEKNIIIKIKTVIFKNVKTDKYKFFLYWSRANWTCRKRSDYDIWVIWDKKLDIITKVDIEEAFENIPALIDFTDFSQVSEEFKTEAMKKIIWLNK